MLSAAIDGLPPGAVLTISFVLGLVIGSFLNVVIHRIPLGHSLVRPGSSCPTCYIAISPWDNLPIVSFILLRGRCRNCRQRISVAYPLIELATAILFTLIVWLHGPTWRSLGEFWFAAIMIALASIDARHHILPDRITYPSLVIAVVAALSRSSIFAELDPTLDSEAAFSKWGTALFGSAIILTAAAAPWLLDQLDIVLFDKYYDLAEPSDGGSKEKEPLDDHTLDRLYSRLTRLTLILGVVVALAWLIAVVVDSPRDPALYQAAANRLSSAGLSALISASMLWVVRAGYFYLRGIEGMGLGDVKLMAITGAFLGWPAAVVVLLLASVIGVIVGVGIARKTGEGLKARLPLGACLGSAAIFVMLLLDIGIYT